MEQVHQVGVFDFPLAKFKKKKNSLETYEPVIILIKVKQEKNVFQRVILRHLNFSKSLYQIIMVLQEFSNSVMFT